jgi:hypothetical protein
MGICRIQDHGLHGLVEDDGGMLEYVAVKRVLAHDEEG